MTSVDVDLEKLAAAHSEQNKEANRRWAVCAGLSLFAFTIDPAQSTQTVFEITLSTANINQIVVVLLSLTNFVYVVAHINGYNTEKMFREICDERSVRRTKISANFYLGDYLNAVISSNYNRVGPLFAGINNERLRIFLYKVTKFVVDTAQISIAPAAIVTLVRKTGISNEFVYLVWVVSMLSIFASLGLWIKSIIRIVKIKS